MELIATTRPPVAYVYGANLSDDGTYLICGLLLVQRGNTRRAVSLRCPNTKQRIRVRLPEQALKAAGDLRFRDEELEVLRE